MNIYIYICILIINAHISTSLTVLCYLFFRNVNYSIYSFLYLTSKVVVYNFMCKNYYKK